MLVVIRITPIEMVELHLQLVQTKAEIELRHRELILVGKKNPAHGGMVRERHGGCLYFFRAVPYALPLNHRRDI